MAKTATRIAPRKPSAPPPRQAQTASKVQRAAEHQGRAAPEPHDDEPKGRPVPAHPRANVPATRQQAAPPVSLDTLSSLPAFMRNDVDIGKQNIKQEDMEIPRLKLIQGLSPELQSYDELRAGNFFHPASEMIFDEPFRVVVIYMDRRYILWNPRESGGGILARADDGVHWSPSSGEFNVTLDKKDGGHQVTWRLEPTVQKSGLANWGSMNPKDPSKSSPPAATLMLNYLLAFPDYPDLMPAILTFQRSAIRAGRQFNTKIRTVRGPLFGSMYEVSSEVQTNNRGQDFYVPMVRSRGLITDEGMYNVYKSMYSNFAVAGLSIKDIEGLQEEGETAGDNTTDEQDKSPHNRY